MKQIKELRFEELTTEQKLGMIQTVYIRGDYSDGNKEYIYDLIRNRKLGSIWVQFSDNGAQECLDRIKEIADYPILIITDAESGMGDYFVGHHNAIGCTGDEKYAYAFGKATAVTARKMGYNVVCDPVVDMVNRAAPCSANNRSMGSDKVRVTELAAAMARGLHDGGVLTVAKHFPGGFGGGYRGGYSSACV